jgi:hypothetical protein
MSAMVAVKLLVEKEIAAQSTPAPGQGEAQRGVA